MRPAFSSTPGGWTTGFSALRPQASTSGTGVMPGKSGASRSCTCAVFVDGKTPRPIAGTTPQIVAPSGWVLRQTYGAVSVSAIGIAGAPASRRMRATSSAPSVPGMSVSVWRGRICGARACAHGAWP